MSRRAVIIGGSGQIGQAAAANLLAQGWSVVSVQRNNDDPPPGLAGRVEVMRADRDKPGELERILAGGADALIDTVAFEPKHAAQLLERQGDIGTMIVISSAGVYCDDEGRTLDGAATKGFPRFPVPISENQPRTEGSDASYGTRKVALEDALLQGAKTNLTILRPGAIYGPGSRGPREWWVLKRILDGRPVIPLAYGGQSRFQPSATANIAELCRLVLDRPGVRVLHAADAQAPPAGDLVAAIVAQMKSDTRPMPFEGPPKGFAGWHPWMAVLPQVLDMSAAEALGYRPVTDYRGFIGETCDDLLARADGRPWREAFPGLAPYPDAMFEYEAEDRFLREQGDDA